eukprot:c9007_g1_i2 orf=489-1652(-)
MTMGASSRSKRQPKNAGHCYTQVPLVDGDDISFHANAQVVDESCAGRNSSKDSKEELGETVNPRRNLALRKTSRSQERANAKERAEALQLERAIRESLASEGPNPGRESHTASDSNRDASDVADSDEDVTTFRRDSVAFQCLVDAASEASNPGLPACNGEELPKLVKETKKRHGLAQDDLKAKTQVDSDYSCEEEEDESDNDDDEDYGSDNSDDSKCRKKRPKKSQEKNLVSLKKQAQAGNEPARVKKARSSRLASRGRNLLPRNASVDKGSIVEGVVAVCANNNAPSGCGNGGTVIKMTASNSMATPHVRSKEIVSGAVLVENCHASSLDRHLKASKDISHEVLFEASDSKALQFQSPTVPHRRVIGLSRRFRPPPLHPYLARTEG